MSTVDRGLHLTLQESLARDLIVERVARRHHVSRRRTSRAALILRSLADRLDHSERVDCAHAASPRVVAAAALVGHGAPSPPPPQLTPHGARRRLVGGLRATIEACTCRHRTP